MITCPSLSEIRNQPLSSASHKANAEYFLNLRGKYGLLYDKAKQNFYVASYNGDRFK